MDDKLKIDADFAHLRGDYGLDGWRLADLKGGHIIDLRVGHGFMIYALTLWDESPDDWRLIQIDCAVAEVDIEVQQENTVWSCPQLVLAAPAEGPPLRLLDEPYKGEYKVKQATIEASTPETYEFKVYVHTSAPAQQEESYCLQFNEKGLWSLRDDEDSLLLENPKFSTGFNIYLCSKEPWWHADDTVKLVDLD